MFNSTGIGFKVGLIINANATVIQFTLSMPRMPCIESSALSPPLYLSHTHDDGHIDNTRNANRLLHKSRCFFPPKCPFPSASTNFAKKMSLFSHNQNSILISDKQIFLEFCNIELARNSVRSALMGKTERKSQEIN